MKFNVKKLTSLLTASLLTAGGLVGLAAQPASATTNATGGTIRLVSPAVDTSVNGYDLQSDADNFVGLGYYPPGLTFKQTYLPYGSSMTLTYEARDSSNALVNQGVMTLAVNKQYSSSNASFTTTSTNTVGGAISGTSVNVILTAPIDQNGRATFQLVNTNTSSQAETISSLTAAPPTSGKRYTQVIPAVASLASAGVDLTEFHFYDPAALPAPMSATSTVLNFSNGLHSLASYDNSVASVATPPTSKTTCSSALKVTKGTSPDALWSVAKVASFSDRKIFSSTDSVLTVNMYAPTAGKKVLFKITPASTGPGIEQLVTTVSGWQRISLDFSTSTATNSPYNVAWNSSATYTDLFVGVDFDDHGSSLDYYFDDFAFNGGTTPALNSNAPVSCATQDLDVRLVSSQKNTGTDAYEWTSCGGASWCVTNNYYLKMIASGASTTLNYVVTGHGTSTPVSGATVHLRMNTAYSGTNATWSSNGTNFPGVSGGTGNDGGYITGTTNSSGEVSFTFNNTNSSGEASRTLNNSSPYPAGCSSPAGQTKGALQPEVTALTSGAGLGTQYVDVLWPHISSSTINSAIAAGSDGVQPCPVAARPGTKVWSPAFDANNNGHYPHIRLEKSFLNEKLDGTWWDGVWQYRDADTRAYLKYIPAGSTFALTYTVTNEWGQPYEGAKVSLIVNANYSCSKTYFAYEGSLIGPDDCAGGGQTELPAKVANSKGQVTFVLTNTNTTGEAMPVDLNGAPNPASKELGTNIKPHVVGATQEGIDMLFAHFVSETGKAKATGPGAKSATIGTAQQSEFVLTDESGNPITNTDVKYFVNGFDSKVGFAHTDYQGKVTIRSTNSSGQEGMQTVGVSLARDGKLPISGTATLNWVAPEFMIAATGNAGAVVVKVAGAAGKTVQITVAGKTYRRLAQTANAEFSIPAAAGKKAVKVVVSGKTLSKSVTVTK